MVEIQTKNKLRVKEELAPLAPEALKQFPLRKVGGGAATAVA